MIYPMDLTPERPTKRVRQACEPCRRKKAKCPGEQPVCSLCARLHQTCVYDGERQRFLSSHPAALDESTPVPALETQLPQRLEDRLGGLEAKMGEVLDALAYLHTLPHTFIEGLLTNITRKTGPRREQQSAANLPLPAFMNGSVAPSISNPSTPLPSWDSVLSIAELYLLYCESQPLPLFHRSTFLSTLGNRDSEIIYAILALSIRFSELSSGNADELADKVNSYTEVARSLVTKRVWEGPVELSTLQSLCLLSLVDFTNGNTHRSIIHGSLAMNLAQCANLGSEFHIALTPVAREERRRCFWSICLLKRLHGGELANLGFPNGGGPPFPESPDRPPLPFSPENATDASRSTDLQDQGIIAYVVILSEVFAKTAGYVRRHGKPSSVPPWSSQSEYFEILALQMDLETRMPYTHRFKPAKLSERTTDQLEANRDYWGPWFLNQFLYHTNLCLLNHPLLLSLSLRNFRSSIPEIFLQHSSDLISSHTTWIVYFIDYFEEKSFIVSDPLLGYGAAVVATIELQLSFTENPAIREEKRERFDKCVRFVQRIGQKWPHMARMAERLQRLEGAVSASYQPNTIAQNNSLLIDLSRFWEILEYSSNSDATSARRMFGDSLYAGPPKFDVEVSQTSPLPEPTRLDVQHGHPHTPSQEYNIGASFPDGLQYTMDALASPRPASFLNDEFSILATNFFSQGQEFLRSGDNREGMGDF